MWKRSLRGREDGRGGERERERDSGEKGADKQRRWLKENRNRLLSDIVSMASVIIPPAPPSLWISSHWSLNYNPPTTKNNNRLPGDFGTEEEISHPLPPPLLLRPPSSASPSVSVPALCLHLSSDPSLSRPRCASLGGHGVAAVWVPLHVTDAPHGLHLGAAGAVLIEMPELALLQHVLAATVAGELVTHPTAEREREQRKGGKKKWICTFSNWGWIAGLRAEKIDARKANRSWRDEQQTDTMSAHDARDRCEQISKVKTSNK